MSEDKFLTPIELAQRWRGAVSVGTINNWRVSKTRKGPPYIKVAGRCCMTWLTLRSTRDCIEFLAARLKSEKHTRNKNRLSELFLLFVKMVSAKVNAFICFGER